MTDMELAVIFREEASELLEELEAAILALEKEPADPRLVSRVFRAMHTIKGSGAMFGFEVIADFTHHVETALDKVRQGKIAVSKELIDLILNSRDHISALLNASAGKGKADLEDGQRIITALQTVVTENATPKEPSSPAPASDEEPIKPDHDAAAGHYRIRLRTSPAFFEGGNTMEPIIAELRNLGECMFFSHGPTGEELPTAGQQTDTTWEFLLTTNQGINAIKDVLIFAESSCNVELTQLKNENGDDPEFHKRLGEILIERGDLSAQDLSRVLSMQKPIGEMLVEEKLLPSSKIEAALAEQKIIRPPKTQSPKETDSIRVAADKLDQLINLVGELVVTQARLSEITSKADDPNLVESVEGIARLTAELRDSVLGIRMLPIGTTFSRFKRLVRDLSAELGKEVALVTEGAETELDKNMIDQLSEPLVHLIRNSIDHGIEPPAERLEKGKTRQGTIRLAASHAGANVVITITDDGKGLDCAALHKKSLEKGLIRPDEDVCEQEIFNTIFQPGLSTAKSVTAVSGRGVGMDVVKSTIDRLKGSAKVSESKKNKGTTITITLPLTMAIIEGLLVQVAETYFVLPLSQVEECVELSGADIARFHGRHMLPVRDQLIPYVRLRDFFAIPGQRPELEQMAIVDVNGEQFGLVLDDVIGEHQTVLKSLGWVYRNAVGLSGSTILGNGEVALILDVPEIMRRAKTEEAAAI